MGLFVHAKAAAGVAVAQVVEWSSVVRSPQPLQPPRPSFTWNCSHQGLLRILRSLVMASNKETLLVSFSNALLAPLEKCHQISLYFRRAHKPENKFLRNQPCDSHHDMLRIAFLTSESKLFHEPQYLSANLLNSAPKPLFLFPHTNLYFHMQQKAYTVGRCKGE